MFPDPRWQPTTFRRYVRTVASSSRVALIRTDAGTAYLKAINNPEGPHILACDWLGTHLARRFGLQTFDIALLELTELDEIPITENTLAQPGPAFVARGERGSSMGGQRALTNVENVEDIPRILVFDTWMRNCDRYGSDLWADILKSLPAAWGVPDEVKTTIDRFLLARARFLADNLHAIVHRELSPDALDFGTETEVQDE